MTWDWSLVWENHMCHWHQSKKCWACVLEPRNCKPLSPGAATNEAHAALAEPVQQDRPLHRGAHAPQPGEQPPSAGNERKVHATVKAQNSQKLINKMKKYSFWAKGQRYKTTNCISSCMWSSSKWTLIYRVRNRIGGYWLPNNILNV